MNQRIRRVMLRRQNQQWPHRRNTKSVSALCLLPLKSPSAVLSSQQQNEQWVGQCRSRFQNRIEWRTALRSKCFRLFQNSNQSFLFQQIGKLRFISVSEFRGKPYVNIREYYDDKGVEKPSKKGELDSVRVATGIRVMCAFRSGISLAADQWEKLKSLINQVDEDSKKSRGNQDWIFLECETHLRCITMFF